MNSQDCISEFYLDLYTENRSEVYEEESEDGPEASADLSLVFQKVADSFDGRCYVPYNFLCEDGGKAFLVSLYWICNSREGWRTL